MWHLALISMFNRYANNKKIARLQYVNIAACIGWNSRNQSRILCNIYQAILILREKNILSDLK